MKTIFGCSFVLVLILIAAPVNADDFQDAVDAYKLEDYKTAFEKFKPLAEQGHADAQYNLAVMYGDGRGVTQDYREAVKWYRLSAEQGNAEAQITLGEMYATGKGVIQDSKEAIRLYKLSARQGNAIAHVAQHRLGEMYKYGLGVTRDYKEAIKWYKLSAEQGNAKVQSWLGMMYYYGKGVAQDYKEAVKWYRLSAEQGIALAQSNLGVMYEEGQGVVQDYKEAGKWFRKSAEQGFAGGQNNLGVMYEKGQGIVQDYQEAVKWYRLSAEQGNAGAQFRLGVIYYYGKGVAQDFKEAVKWYWLAAKQGHTQAQTELGIMFVVCLLGIFILGLIFIKYLSPHSNKFSNERHYYYWLGPTMVVGLMVYMYFSGIEWMQTLVAPEKNREFGLLENLHNVILISVVFVAIQGIRRRTLTLEKIAFFIVILGSIFLLLEETDYGRDYIGLLRGEKIKVDFRSLHNLNQNRYLPIIDQIVYSILILFFCIYPLAARRSSNPWVRYLAPEIHSLGTVFSMFTVPKIAYFIYAPTWQPNMSLENMTEFSEVFVYYIFFIYFFELVYKR